MSAQTSDFQCPKAIVHVSDSAIMHLMLAGMESFHVRLKGKHVLENPDLPPVETAGLLIGYSCHRNKEDHFVIEHATTDKFAKGFSSRIGPLIDTVTEEKRKVIQRQWPHLQIIGDFHTHPYTSYSQAERHRGWEFSSYDIKFHEELNPEDWEGRCALVLTIAELKRVQEDSRRSNERWAENVIHWQLGDYRFWLSVIVLDGIRDADSNRFVVSPKQGINKDHMRPKVYLNVPTIRGVDQV